MIGTLLLLVGKVYELLQEVNTNNSALNENCLELGKFSGLQQNESFLEIDGDNVNETNHQADEAIYSHENEEELPTSVNPNFNNNVEKTLIHGQKKQGNKQCLNTGSSQFTRNCLSQSSTFTIASTSRNQGLIKKVNNNLETVISLLMVMIQQSQKCAEEQEQIQIACDEEIFQLQREREEYRRSNTELKNKKGAKGKI
ncbi:hypothetical protein O181_108391 [Austropuccinia psidii MF-1]|uniref:Uncharacterized protein n=1 Tax=Austropuccinia psidii MF-1 TaxID=1389203 RepID=A0A9Q3JV78_9BASI|nr:hypothetical protein [Austropuccinia psidii MF-1]